MLDWDLVQTAARRLAVSGLKVGTAESLTSGLLSAALTAVPGSSAYFEGAVVAYSNRLKTHLLGVPHSLLAEHGAVSEACARAMAAGVRERLGLDLALATTGIAGPEGGSPAKPVGTVWVALSGPQGDLEKKHHFTGDRNRIAVQAAEAALQLLLNFMK